MIARCIRAPVAVTLLSLGVLLLGALAYTTLPIATLPSIDRPTISVFASLPGASPTTVASSIGVPLERELGLIPGVADMTSISSQAGQEIDIQFSLDDTVDAAAAAVQAALNSARQNLPKNLPEPPTYYKADPGGVAMIVLSLTSNLLSPGDVYDVADSVVAQHLSQIPGVSRVLISGAQRGAIRVRVNPLRLADMGLSIETVRNAITAATREMPKGHVDREAQRIGLETNDEIFTAAAFREVVVSLVHGVPVRLGDVAEVTNSVLNDRQAGWFGTTPAVNILVFRQIDANVVATVDRVRQALPQLQRWMPASIKLHVVFDRTSLIRASIADLERTIGIAIGLVVMVLALFLRRFWATLVPVLTIPIVLAGTLAVMALAGYSIDNLSLMALTIGVGFAVDDAVIVTEAVTRRMEKGGNVVVSTLRAMSRMGSTIVAITMALAAALIPVLFMPDIVGRYFQEFGVTLIATIAISMVVSLTIAPTLCAALLGRDLPPRPRRTGSLSAFYARSLDFSLRHTGYGLLLTLVISGGTFGLYLVLPKGFMPTQDSGVLHVRTIGSPSISFEEMERLQRQVAEIMMADPAVDALTSFTASDVQSWGDLWIGLKPPDQRALMPAVVERLKGEVAAVDGLRVFVNPVQDLTLGFGGSARYQYRLSGTDVDAVLRSGEAMRRRMLALQEITDVIGDADTRSGLSADITVDRVQAARFGVTPLAVDNALYDAFGQRQMALIYLPLSFSKVVLEVDPRYAADPAAFLRMYVPGAGSASVPLAELARFGRTHEPMWVRHAGSFPTMTISFDTRPGVSIGDAINAIRKAQVELAIPEEIRTEFAGEAKEAGKSTARQGLLFLAAILAVVIILGILYESLMHPITILTTLPPAAFGALAALWLTRTELSVLAAVACILVVGIAMKNAILLVDFALAAERDRGLSAIAAIQEAARARARPICMTMLVSVLSALPLAAGRGPGHELRQPLGTAVVGGLLLSLVVTLYSTPVFYVVFNRWRDHLVRNGQRERDGLAVELGSDETGGRNAEL